MKMSLCQMIAIVCILAVGFLTVTPFFPKADADCNYYSESMCDGALEYLVEKINDAIAVCNEEGSDSDECEQATLKMPTASSGFPIVAILMSVSRQPCLPIMRDSGLHGSVNMRIHRDSRNA